jgi:hypothetical protein
LEILNKYGDAINFLTVFNPDKQVEYAENELRCFSGTAPVLYRVSKTYGRNIAENWLEIQLYDLSEYSGCKDKFDTKQVEQVAKVILLNYGYLKVTEFMVFFQKFKAGNYGKFYGSVDGLVITSALHEFINYRANKLDKIKNMETIKRLDKMNENSITYEEYLRLKNN